MSEEAVRGELAEYLAGLEEERRKVEAFKRELPLCMQLLTDAIQSTQAQLKEDDVPMDSDEVSEPHQARDRSHYSHRPIPSRPTAADVSAREPDALAPPPPFPRAGGPAWLSEAISQRGAGGPSGEARALEQRMEGLGPPLAERGPGRPGRDGGEEGGGLPPLFRSPGAFLPFSREQHSPHVVRPVSPHVLSYPLAMHLQHSTMALHAARDNDDSPASVLEERRSQAVAAGPSDTEGGHSGEGTATGTDATGTDATGSSGAVSRKQRRCWSPELHRRFVNALNQLGGSQVATPKQIRELMKVDGLTNDEVKSHLQKYRLHTRRPSPVPTTAPGPGPGQVVMLGSIWVPPEYSAAASSAAALYDAAAAVAAAPSQGAPNAPPGNPLDQSRAPPGASGGFPPGPFFQVLGPRPLPSSRSTELTLAATGEGPLSHADVKEARGSFGGFKLFEAPESIRALDSRDEPGGSSHWRGASMSEDSSDAGRSGEQDTSSEGRGVQSMGPHAFRTFLPPRPDASAHRAGLS